MNEDRFEECRDGDRVWLVRSDRVETLKRNGFSTFDDYLSARGETVNASHVGRDVVRLDLDDGGKTLTGFLKRCGPSDLKDALKDLLRLRRVRTKARVEFEMLREFARAGLDVPRALAFGERVVGGRDRASFLMVERLPCGRPLDALLAEPADPVRRRRLVDALADFVRRMHDAGLSHPDLYAKHLFVEERPDGSWSVATLDLQRASSSRDVSLVARGRELAALLVSVHPDAASARERRQFLCRYLGVRRLGPQELTFVRQRVLPRARRLSRRGVYRAWQPVLETRRGHRSDD